MVVDPIPEEILIPFPPLYAVAVNLMSPCGQPAGELIDPLLRPSLYPGKDGVVHIGDLHGGEIRLNAKGWMAFSWPRQLENLFHASWETMRTGHS